jgi:proteic killer suppression protein
MEVDFQDADLDKMEIDPHFSGGWPPNIVSSYRRKMQLVRAAADERFIRNMKSLHFEKLKPPRDHQYSIRLNDQWRLILELVGEGRQKRIVIVGIEDYH